MSLCIISVSVARASFRFQARGGRVKAWLGLLITQCNYDSGGWISYFYIDSLKKNTGSGYQAQVLFAAMELLVAFLHYEKH